MAVTKGFKQTEAGVIPTDWLDTTIGGLISENVIEKPMDGNHGNIHPKSSDFVDFGVPFVMANNVQNGRVDLDSCSFITKKRADRLQKGFSKSGDVLLTHKATIGNTAIVPKISTDYVMLTPQVTYYRVKDKNRLNNHFLRHAFDGDQFQKTLKQLSGGGTRAYIGISAQHALPIAVPPSKVEQESIANALSDADAYIESLEKLIEKKRAIKKGAMQELLKPKVGWRKSALATICQFANGKPYEGFLVNDGRSKLITLDSISIDGRLKTNHRSVDFDDQSLKQNDIVIILSDIAHAKLLGLCDLIPGDGYVLNQRVGRIRCSEAFSPGFLRYQINKNQEFFRMRGQGSSQKHIYKKDIFELEIDYPDKTEQLRINQILEDLTSELDEISEKLNKVRLIKQGMMQALLTGKIRLI